MKLDLTREQRDALETAVDVLADLIDSLRERKEDLLDKGCAPGQSHIDYLNERVFELQVDMTVLNTCKHSIKGILN